MEGTDPIADLLTRVRNAIMVRHETVALPASRLKIAVARVLKQEGFIEDYQILKGVPQRTLKLNLKYTGAKAPAILHLERVSKPGHRVYVARDDLPRPQRDLRVAIMSTSKGIMTSREAWRLNLGGELMCYVW